MRSLETLLFTRSRRPVRAEEGAENELEKQPIRLEAHSLNAIVQKAQTGSQRVGGLAQELPGKGAGQIGLARLTTVTRSLTEGSRALS